jgi:cytochrome c oxidase cbb3-type subunit 3
MADFLSSGWAWFVALLSVGGLLFCLWLLLASAKTTTMAPDGSTGHVYDGIVELNKPLPRWWLILFVLTVLFSFGYLWLYPGLGVHGGRLGWSQEQQLADEQSAARQRLQPLFAKYQAMDAPQLAQQPEAMAMGQRLFLNHCAQCHGSDAKGSKGFPNLTDADWLWGGSFETVKETITRGRVGQMPALGEAVGSPEQQRNLAHYVLSLSGSAHDSLRAALGRSHYSVCAACHGPKGQGNPALGAPNLSDRIWLHGAGEEAVLAMIRKGKHSEMPGQHKMLSPEQIHVLGAYVLSLSGSVKPK